MKFNLLDKIESLDDTRIVASKCVSLAEEYLADHFPTFPVLPGVLMLEACTQAAGWLLHTRTDFDKSMAILKEARNIRYGHFVAPGNTLLIEVEYLKPSESGGATFRPSSSVGGNVAISGRLELSYFDLSEKSANMGPLDDKIKAHTRARWNVLRTHSPVGSPVGI